MMSNKKDMPRWRKRLLQGFVTACASVAIIVPTAGAAIAAPAAPVDPKVTITVGTFGSFGYEELYDEYEKAHPNVDIKQRITEYAPHHDNLQAHLLAKSGAADIEAIETGKVAAFVSQSDKLVNFKDYGSNPKQWLSWKSAQATDKDGRLVGLGTDVGPMVMAYRADLLKKAGLPSDPEAVAKLWPTWGAYIETGKAYQKNAQKGQYWFDNGGNLMNAIMGQQEKAFYAKEKVKTEDGKTVVVDKVIAKTNPDVRKSYDTVIKGVEAGESARLPGWSPQWTAGFKRGAFATIAAPPWMLDTLVGFTPETVAAGKWNVTTIPGGGGNWGGSFLAVPKQGKHVKESVKLSQWLTAPAQQERVFKEHGHLPSTVSALKSKAVLAKVDERFNDAPVGQLYVESALTLKPQYMGPKHSEISAAINDGIARVEQKKEAPEASWNHAMKDVDKITGNYSSVNATQIAIAAGIALLVLVGLLVAAKRRSAKKRLNAAEEDQS
jgi:cellobiose transport system substrate-binding protein